MQRKMQKDQAEIQLRMADQKRLVDKDKIEATIDVQKVQLDKQEMAIEAQKDGIKIALDKQSAKDKLDIELMRLIEQQNKGQ